MAGEVSETAKDNGLRVGDDSVGESGWEETMKCLDTIRGLQVDQILICLLD